MTETEERLRALEAWCAESRVRWEHQKEVNARIDALRISGAKLTGIVAAATSIGGLVLTILAKLLGH